MSLCYCLQLKRAEHGRSMLLSKLENQGEKAALMTELDLLRQENSTLSDAVESGDRQCACLQQEVETLRATAQSTQTELSAKNSEITSLTKELHVARDALSVQRNELDMELSRVQADLRKAEDHARAAQLEAMERSHTEGRLKGELASADNRCAQLEADSMALRRRLLEMGEERDREVSQLQSRIRSLETELRNVVSDLSRSRAPTNLQSGYSVPSSYLPPSHVGPGTYYTPSVPPLPPGRGSSAGGYVDDYHSDRDGKYSVGAGSGDGSSSGVARNSRESDEYERLVRGSGERSEGRNGGGKGVVTTSKPGGRQSHDSLTLSQYAGSSLEREDHNIGSHRGHTDKADRGGTGLRVHQSQPTSLRGALRGGPPSSDDTGECLSTASTEKHTTSQHDDIVIIFYHVMIIIFLIALGCHSQRPLLVCGPWLILLEGEGDQRRICPPSSPCSRSRSQPSLHSRQMPRGCRWTPSMLSRRS